MKFIYLALAVIGAIVPFVFIFPFMREHSFGLTAFVSGLFANGAGGGTMDLVISSVVFCAYMFRQRGRGPQPWPFIALNLFVGLSSALPAYLYAREKAELEKNLKSHVET